MARHHPKSRFHLACFFLSAFRYLPFLLFIFFFIPFLFILELGFSTSLPLTHYFFGCNKWSTSWYRRRLRLQCFVVGLLRDHIIITNEDMDIMDIPAV